MPDYDDYQRLLSDIDATVECAEAHGILCGILSLDPNSQRGDWLGLDDERPNQLFAQRIAENQTVQHTDAPQGVPQEYFLGEAGASPQGAAAIAELVTLHRETRTQLNSMDYSFSPLLPEDNEPIASRTQALSLWCQGFLFGLSVSGLKTLDALSEASREIVEDFSSIAQLEEQFEEGENEESAYMELVEYLRIGTFTLIDEHSKQPDSETLH